MALLMPTPEEGLQSGLTEGPDSSKKDFSGGSTLYSWAGVKTVGQNLWDKYSCKGGYFAGGWDLGSMVMLYGVTIFIPPAFLKASGGNPNGAIFRAIIRAIFRAINRAMFRAIIRAILGLSSGLRFRDRVVGWG